MQHLVAYSGETVDNPVAPRTREAQDGIVSQSKRLGRPVRFGDLTRRWAADSQYARSIVSVAERYRSAHCNGSEPAEVVAAVVPTAPEKKRGAVLAKQAIEESAANSRVALGATTASAVIPYSWYNR